MNRWSFWPVLVALLTVFILVLLCQIPGIVSLLMIPISLVSCAIVSAFILIAVIVLVVKKRFRRAASLLLALLAPILLLRPIVWAADCMHLGLTIGFGIGQIGSAPDSRDSGFASYDWSVGLAIGPATFLIYDVTDEISLPMALHKHPLNPKDGLSEGCAGKVDHLLGHYYICTF